MDSYEKTGYLTKPYKMFHITDKSKLDIPFHYHDFHKILIHIKGNVSAIMAFKNSWIKCLIWLGFLFVSSAITTGLAYAGVRLGGVPTILLFAVACYAARSCCKAYDRKHAPLPSVADTGEEPKSASLVADGAAAEEPAERQENREEAKMGEIIQLPKAKSVQPEQPVIPSRSRDKGRIPHACAPSAIMQTPWRFQPC